MARNVHKIIAIGKNGRNIVFVGIEDAALFFGLPEKKVYKAISRGDELNGYYFDFLFEK